ncbi:MAG: restriction endonuclease [Candidatus Hodarchaeales archaeon]
MTMNILSRNLHELVVTVFESLGFTTIHPALVFRHPLADSRLSLVLKLPNTNDFVGIIIRDWKKIVGISEIHRAEELLLKCSEIPKIIIVSSMGFSSAAKQQAERVGLDLVTRKEIISLLVKRIELE